MITHTYIYKSIKLPFFWVIGLSVLHDIDHSSLSLDVRVITIIMTSQRLEYKSDGLTAIYDLLLGHGGYMTEVSQHLLNSLRSLNEVLLRRFWSLGLQIKSSRLNVVSLSRLEGPELLVSDRLPSVKIVAVRPSVVAGVPPVTS